MQEYAHLRLRRSMDRTKVSGTFDVGSIPSGASFKMLSKTPHCIDNAVFFIVRQA